MAIKMALFPLHFWLPDAHSYAPPVVAAILRRTDRGRSICNHQADAQRFSPDFFSQTLPVTTIIGWMSAAGIIFGSVMAIAQKDFKRMLAYSTVAQIGYIGLGIGLANPLGLIGGMLHILNHAFMKSCLFLVAGGVRYQTDARYRGICRSGQKNAADDAGFTVAALSMVGIPPTAGFFSKCTCAGTIDCRKRVFLAVIL
jgi:multicomponent Na+:H+ antiporter subunit D